MGPARAPEPGRLLVVLAFASVSFIALVLFAFGFGSLLLDQPVIDAPGLRQLPGVFGTGAAVIAFSASTSLALCRRASVGMAVLAGVVAGFGYVAGVAVGALVAGADLFRAWGVAGTVALSWPVAVVVVAGVFTATVAVVIIRSGPGVARWPWERADE